MNDVEYQIECTTLDLASYLVKDFSFSIEQSLRAVSRAVRLILYVSL